MAPIDRCMASVAKLSLAPTVRPSISSTIPRFLAPSLVQTRHASVVKIGRKKQVKKAKPLSKDFKRHKLDKADFPQFTLCEALRILRAYEVGKPPGAVKYEMHVHLKTARNGPVIKSSIRLPNPVQSDWQIAVVCPEGSDIANAAVAAGAKLVGEETLFQAIRDGNITFDRLICHELSEKKLQKAQLGKILGPKGLMPSARMKTVVKDVAKAIRDSAGSSDYREREGAVRMAIGQLAHSPEQLKANIEAVMKKLRAQCAEISEENPKEVHEVILSTTNGPGISLNGKFRNLTEEITPQQLSGPM
ncbi:ribosomal protein L1-like protein [Emericellopsis atlantica]|uniref:Ribosomal protein L1-like protein n=1 Tax=Emericellopsis atlantica TaxID=2614577 RepID=A0A9P7ZEJ0_9HYPO|nr:ribosomal protein L1-like protein [Emericellopsis atlantica]KAG9250281.1 ribosomal protein L1-like protein [Emericellopsis atlantica]